MEQPILVAPYRKKSLRNDLIFYLHPLSMEQRAFLAPYRLPVKTNPGLNENKAVSFIYGANTSRCTPIDDPSRLGYGALFWTHFLPGAPQKALTRESTAMPPPRQVSQQSNGGCQKGRIRGLHI